MKRALNIPDSGSSKPSARAVGPATPLGKAVSEKMLLEQIFCKSHPESEANWRCVECSSEFCDACVKIWTFALQGIMASCPECKNGCVDFKAEAAEQHRLFGEWADQKRRNVFRYVGFVIISLPFLYEVVTWSKSTLLSDLKFLLFIAGACWIGPLRGIDSKYKMGSLISFSWLLFFFLWVPVVSTPLKYLLIAIPMIPLFFLVEKASDFFSQIYR